MFFGRLKIRSIQIRQKTLLSVSKLQCASMNIASRPNRHFFVEKPVAPKVFAALRCLRRKLERRY